MKGFEAAYNANRNEQIKKVQEINKDINKVGFRGNLNFYLIDVKEAKIILSDNYIIPRLLSKKKMLDIVDNFNYKFDRKEKWDEKMAGFIKNLEPDPETLNVRNCCFFIMAENFEKAEYYLRKIKNKNYYKIFKSILEAESENYNKSLKLFNELVSNIKDIPDFIVSFLYAKIGVIYFESKNSKLSFKYWKKAKSLDRENYLANMSLFWARYFK